MPEPNTRDGNKVSGAHCILLPWGLSSSSQAHPNATKETGWSGIEDYMGEDDKSQMKVLNEDIDALLIFAGLFSAVLTAFVVSSYLLLQPDNTQLTVRLLSQISAQLARFEILPPFINSTASQPTASPAFQVSTSARWMNCLWFLSLIFSLSSALFGILAKQWIREYLQWRKVAAAPRENVLLRQLRIEAWDDWKVSVGISAIPALLELAVVLFLAGLVVLVWTLDEVVAIVITTAVSIVIMALCTVTVLPAFYRRCPYKSPTGWACVVIFDALPLFLIWIRKYLGWILTCIEFGLFLLFLFACLIPLHVIGKICRANFQFPRRIAATCRSLIFRPLITGRDSLPSFPQFSNWRERDLYIDDSGSSEISRFSDVALPDDRLPPAKRSVAKDICEIMPLVRALSWVRKGTEDPQLLKHVARSAQSLHTDSINAEDRYYVFAYVLRKLCSAKSESRELQSLGKLEDQLLSKTYQMVGIGQVTFQGGIFSAYDYLDPPVDKLLDHCDIWVLGYLLFYDTMFKSSTHKHLCLLRHFLAVHDDPTFHAICRIQLQKLYNDAMPGSQPDTHHRLRHNGVHTMMLEMLCSTSEVRTVKRTKLISADRPRFSADCIDNEIRLAIQTFDQNAGYSDHYARHQFVMMTDLVIRSLDDCYVRNKDLMGTLLQKMLEAMTISLEKGYKNCGCYHSLPWTGSMLALSDWGLRFWMCSQPLWSLLDVLDKSLPAAGSNDEAGDGDDDSDEGDNPEVYKLPLTRRRVVRGNFFKLKEKVETLRPRSPDWVQTQ
ncbi:hypothetical protein PHLCEN_2v4225 [Hermanssonia centrifuga]|uniref:DUF6535 domain-containing protein n=1 Tax=Hermanssonia centrifuga TaxID=98765 RepID=A0A2R6PZN9_9APHY|nr:hypothetical protein PHLCEN_2v4225 [Hermanssonia centrifuga]